MHKFFRDKNKTVFILLCLINTVTYCFSQQFSQINDKIIIASGIIDLHGATKCLPKNYTLIVKNGIIKNGTLIGNQTKLQCSGKIFDNVHIKGIWNIPHISTSMFVDLSYENALKDVLALANSKMRNTITIEKGNYKVKANKNKDACLTLCGNTELILNGVIQIIPNEYPRYDIIRANGRDISIRGNGMIVGDKHTHLGSTGEWGMGIRFHEAMNASVSGLTIKDCWGDCIYVGGNSKNVLIEKCILDHGRRQGISVTKADGVSIKKCRISNVSGTNPQYAIDLEPNANDTVKNILIENVEVVDCEGGFLATIGKKNVEKKNIGKVQIKNCNVSALSKYPIRMTSCETLSVEDCIISVKNEKSAIYTKNTCSVIVRNNLINVKQEILLSVKNTVKEVIGKKGFVPINVIQAEKQEIRDNKIVER